MSLHVFRADVDRQVAALRILLSQFPADEQEARLLDTLAAVNHGALSLTGLWLAELDQRPIGAALVMTQADGVSLVWLPVILIPDEQQTIRSALMTEICRELDGPGIKFGQILLSPEESAACGWLVEYGFESAAELFFLARSLEEGAECSSTPHSDFEIFDEPRNYDRFARLIERTYLDSLDCPRLNGERTGVDAIAGHRLSGQFHPRGWRLYQHDGQDAAVLLLNEHPDQDAVELVYFGVAPEFRGRHWGQRLLADAIELSRSWNRAAIFLAVDAANTFANDLYAAHGFQEVARRVVWLRFPRASARE